MTGLPNRHALEERLAQALAAHAKSGEPAALVSVGLGRLAQIRESFGLAAGDRVLRVAADRLRRALRGSDVIARVGDHEFALLLTHLRDPQDARAGGAQAVRRARHAGGARKPRPAAAAGRRRGAVPAGCRCRRPAAGACRRRAAPRARPGRHALPVLRARPDRAHDAPVDAGSRPARRASSATSSAWCTSRASTPSRAGSPVPRRCCAGSTRSAACWRRRSFSTSPSPRA
ncbi:MAG: GGDEF domain-containing protein [Rhodopseudomonas palustris]|nr:GGDEF domain-containing protein [Rhodopseudomonas palustris]